PASVSADPVRAATGAVGSGSSSALWSRTSVNGPYVTVSVDLMTHTDIPLIGMLLPDIEVHGSATMILEPP
ncbi:MAG: hypothetical protein ABIW84_01235, partial [Ilumatobacteraceae bacterium]